MRSFIKRGMSVRKFFAMCKSFCVSIVWNENAPPRRSFAKTANQSSAETINIKFLGFCTQAIVFFCIRGVPPSLYWQGITYFFVLQQAGQRVCCREQAKTTIPRVFYETRSARRCRSCPNGYRPDFR